MSANDCLVPRRGLEPPRFYPLVPETSASTNSATRARARMLRCDARDVNGCRPVRNKADTFNLPVNLHGEIGPGRCLPTYTSARCQKPPRKSPALAPRARPRAPPPNHPRILLRAAFRAMHRQVSPARRRSKLLQGSRRQKPRSLMSQSTAVRSQAVRSQAVRNRPERQLSLAGSLPKPRHGCPIRSLCKVR